MSALVRCSLFRAFFHRTTFASAAALALVAAPSPPAQAQAGADDVLEEILVTARRREESLQDVPVAISVLNENFLIEQNVLDHFDLYAETPGVEYKQSGDRLGSRPAIRGVSTTQQNILVTKIGTFIDGAPLLGNSGSLQFTNLERIEVLRGPQSAAFGRANFAGAFHYITQDPGEEHTSTIKVATSDLSRNMLGISLDGPLTDTLGYTLDLYQDEFLGPDEWIATDGTRVGTTATGYYSGKLKWTPSDRFDMEVRASFLDSDDGPDREEYLSEASRDACANTTLANGRPYITGVFNCDLPTGPARRNGNLALLGGFAPGTLEYDIALANSVLDPRSEFERTRLQAEFNFPMEDGSLLQVITSYNEEEGTRWGDSDGTDATPITVNTRNNTIGMNTQSGGSDRIQEETYVDVRWVSPGDQPLRWLVGASVFDFFRKNRSFRQFTAILHPELGLADSINGGAPFRPNRRQFQDTTATGIYGNLTYDLSDRTTVSFEGRLQEDDVLTIEESSGNTVRLVTESFQPRLAINHAVNDEWSVYGQLSQGSNPARSTPAFADPVIIASLAAARAGGLITYDETTFRDSEEEILTNLEFGIKGSAFDGRLQLAAAVYTMDWEQMILGGEFDWLGSDPDPVTGTCFDPGGMRISDCWNDGSFDPNGVIYDDNDVRSGMVALNRGDGDLSGIEVEATWHAGDNLSFRGMLSLMDNTYAENCDQEPIDDFRYTPTLTIEDDGVLFDCYDVSGNRIEAAVEEQAALSASYRAPLGGTGWQWLGRLGLRYQGSEFMEMLNLMELPAVTTMNGTLSLSNDNWRIVLFGNNLTNEDQPRRVRGLRNDRSITHRNNRNFDFDPRIPREIGVRLDFSF